MGTWSERRASRDACFFSIQKLFGIGGGAEAGPTPAAEVRPEKFGCKLWTLTGATAEVRENPRLLAERAGHFFTTLNRWGYRFVAVLELKGLNWHYHMVTPDFWPAKRLWALSERCGLGRIDVKGIPVEHVYYVIKYLMKDMSGSSACGLRRWRAVGFEGVKVRDIVYTVRTRHLSEDAPEAILWDRIATKWNGQTVHVAQIRIPALGTVPKTKTMDIKQHWIAPILRELARGNPVLLGEYRGCEAVVRESAVWSKGQPTDQKALSVVLEHFIEVGRGDNRKLREKLPVTPEMKKGQDVTEAMTPPAKKGDIVCATITRMSDQWGDDFGGLVNLTALAEPVKGAEKK